MSSLKRKDVNDAVCGQFWKCWTDATNGAATIITTNYTPEVRWWTKNYGTPPPVDKHWLQFTMRTLNSEQATFRGTEIDATRGERYRTKRLVIIEMYFSKLEVQDEVNDDLMELARSAFVQPVLNGCILFRRVTAREQDADEDFLRATVSAQFEYDEIIGAN